MNEWLLFSLVEIGTLVPEEIFKLRLCIFAFCYPPLVTDMALHLNKFESYLHMQGYNEPSLVDIGSWFFKCFVTMYFRYFVIIYI